MSDNEATSPRGHFLSVLAVDVSVRENVCNNSKKRKKSCFLGFEKNVKSVLQFQGSLNHFGL